MKFRQGPPYPRTASSWKLALCLVALSLVALGAPACGEQTIVAVGGGPPDAFPTGTPDDALPPGDTAADADTSTGGDTEPGPPEPSGEREIIVLHDTSAPVTLMVEEQVLLRVKVIDYGAAGPAVNALVGWTIVDNPQGGDANLTTSAAFTDANGEVSVTFRAQSTPEASYTVEVDTAGAAPVQIPVYVQDTPQGDIAVKLAYEGPINVKNVHLRLFEGGYTCGQFNPVAVPTDVLGDKIVPGVGSGVEVGWEDLPADTKFTVVATAQSPTGSLAAAGCLDGIVVLPDDTNTVTLTLYLLTLNPAGSYDTENIFDFTGAIPGELGQLVDQIVLLFNDPGQFLINQVKALVASYIGELITDIAFSLFEDALADIITDWMLNNSPQWIQDIFTIGQDLTQVVNNLEMLADLHISKLSNDYYVQGVLWWTGIVLYWHFGCPDEGAPDYDPECGKFVFSLDAFTDTQFPMDIVEGKFTGLIQNFDHLDIDNHVIKINYGKLILFVLNELILPAVTGENNLVDAVLSFVNCWSIANSFVGDILGALGIDAADVAGFCEDAITLIVAPVAAVIGSLALDSQLRLTGTAILVDDNNDLVVDRIIDGVYVGHIEVDGAEGPEFDGVWSGERIP